MGSPKSLYLPRPHRGLDFAKSSPQNELGWKLILYSRILIENFVMDGSEALFASRAERYPQPDATDTTRAALDKALSAIPVFGPTSSFILSKFWVPSLNRRMEEWLKDFAEAFDRHCQECNIENLANDEAFISASIQATRIAVATHLEEKRQYLRNALLNIALGKGPDEVRRQLFFNAIESFAPAHVKALNVILRGGGQIPWDKHIVPLASRNYGTALEISVPELQGQGNLVDAIISDLRNSGFCKLGSADQPYPLGGLITNLGVEFLQFVRRPEDIPQDSPPKS